MWSGVCGCMTCSSGTEVGTGPLLKRGLLVTLGVLCVCPEVMELTVASLICRRCALSRSLTLETSERAKPRVAVVVVGETMGEGMSLLVDAAPDGTLPINSESGRKFDGAPSTPCICGGREDATPVDERVKLLAWSICCVAPV